MPTRTAVLPVYADDLAIEHRAQDTQIDRALASLPILQGGRVIDVGAGDGWYSNRLARRVGRAGSVIALDLSAEYLHSGERPAATVQRTVAQADRLPFGNDQFDLAWCAHSMVSLDPLPTLREMRRVTRPGGCVAALETDNLHSLLLPWPPEIELCVRVAELRAFRASRSDPSRPYIARRLGDEFAKAGFRQIVRATFVEDWTSPFASEQVHFLARYFHRLRKLVLPYIAKRHRAVVEAVCTPGSPTFLLGAPLSSVTLLETLVWAIKE